MTANTLENWANFFITSAEVSATLAGLVIVAVSVNLQKILAYRQLPPRASSTVAVLMMVVVIGLAALVPQSSRAFAGEAFIASAITFAILLVCTREIVVAHLKDCRPIMELIAGLPGGHVATLAFMLGAGLLWNASSGSLYWIAAGIAVALVFAVLNAWVFLIEVMR
jgi:hypothetical protein